VFEGKGFRNHRPDLAPFDVASAVQLKLDPDAIALLEQASACAPLLQRLDDLLGYLLGVAEEHHGLSRKNTSFLTPA